MNQPDPDDTAIADRPPRRLYVFCAGVLLVLGGLLVYASIRTSYVAYLQTTKPGEPGKPGVDFEYFRAAGEYFRRHGELPPADQVPGALPWYLPFTTRACVLLAVLPLGLTACLWAVGNVAIFAVVVRYVGRRLVDLPPADWPIHQLLPVLLILWWLAVQSLWNQLSVLVLGGALVSFALYSRRREGLAGIVLGATCLFKLMPAVLLLWFALKRGWRTVAAAALTMVLLGPVWDIVSFGPERTAGYYVEWFDRAVRRGGAAHMIRTGVEADCRNQGLGVVLRHWLMESDCSRKMWYDQRTELADEPWGINVADLSAGTVVWVYRAITLASLAGLIWLTRRPAERLSPQALRLEFAACLCAMCWFAPVMRMYHLVLLYPAVALLLPRALERSRFPRAGRIAVVGVGLYVPLYIASIWGVVNFAFSKEGGTGFWFDAAGFGLWSALAAGGACLAVARREKRLAKNARR